MTQPKPQAMTGDDWFHILQGISPAEYRRRRESIMTQPTNQERAARKEDYEEYCQAKRDIEEIPFTFEDWLEIDQRTQEES